MVTRRPVRVHEVFITEEARGFVYQLESEEDMLLSSLRADEWYDNDNDKDLGFASTFSEGTKDLYGFRRRGQITRFVQSPQ